MTINSKKGKHLPGTNAIDNAGINSLETQVELRRLTHDLIERVKELGCLYGISRLVENKENSLDVILGGVVELIPPAWQYPEVTCARIKLKGRVFKTANFQETSWKQAENILVKGKLAGIVEVYYLEEKPDVYEGPFLKEERDLIHGIAERLGHVVESKIAEDRLRTLYTRERQLYKKLQSEMQSRIDFTRLLIHELKTPLTSLMATSQLLLEETADTRLEKLARYLWDGANGLNIRIDELHDVIRGEIGRLKLKVEPVNIEKLLISLVDETKALSQQYGVTISLDLVDCLPTVSADAERVRQVMLNLISNACKYASEGGKIDIQATRGPDSMVTVEVRDYGHGVSKDRQKNLFKPGYQQQPNQNDRPGGLGIGLALCKTLVELQGGRIWLESKAGRGSSFFFTLSALEPPNG
jgi:signal transduction histidine kinase